MIINKQNLQFLFQQFDQRYQVAYKMQPTYWQYYADEMPSGTETNYYGWIAEISGMREWIGPRLIDDIAARSYSLTNKDYEKTIGLDKNKIADDQYGFFGKTVDMLGMQGKWWPDDIETQTLVNATSTICYDGQPYFNASHPVDLDDSTKGTYSNKLDTTTSGAMPLNLANYAIARAAMMKFKGESGRPLNVVGDTIMVPPDLEGAALQVANAQLTAQAIRNVAGTENVAGAAPTNVFQGTATVIVNPRLTDVNTWYLMCTRRGIKPLIFQNRQSPVFVQRVQPTDENVFHLKRFEYGIDSRGNAGVTFPFLAIRCST